MAKEVEPPTSSEKEHLPDRDVKAKKVKQGLRHELCGRLFCCKVRSITLAEIAIHGMLADYCSSLELAASAPNPIPFSGHVGTREE